MSDFLSQFSKDNYKQGETVQQTKYVQSKQPTVPAVVVAESEKPTRQSQPSRQQRQSFQTQPDTVQPQAAIEGPLHEVEVDKSFNRNRIIRAAIIAVAVLALCGTIFLIFSLSNRVELRDLVGADLNEARSWALRNRIDLNIFYEFDLDADKDKIIAQSPESGKIQRGKLLDITVSNGADPDERIPLPDFAGMDVAAVNDWIKSNKAINARVNRESSDTVEDKQFIRTEFPDDAVNEANYSRKDAVLIYMSKGPEEIRKNITIPNFVNKLKEECEAWAETNKIKLTFKEESSSQIAVERIISQDVEAGTKVAAEHEVELVVSLGDGVVVPDYNTISMDETGASFELMVSTKQRYHASVPYGRVISQSVAAGTKLFGEDKKVEVVYSLGQPFIDDLVGNSESQLPSYFYEFSAKGANVTYTREYVSSSAPKGSIVFATHRSEFIGLSLNVHFHISLGDLEPEVPEIPEMPNFPDNWDDSSNPGGFGNMFR